MIKYTGKTEYFDEEDGCEVDKKTFKKKYNTTEKKSRKVVTNLSKHYGYQHIEIWTETIVTGKRKPEQLKLF